MKKKVFCIAAGLLVISFASISDLYAQRENGRGKIGRWLTQDASVSELERLRKNDPKGFDLYMRKRREMMRQKLEALKETDPLEYEHVVSGMKRRLGERLEEIGEQQPQRAQRLKKRYRYQERKMLERLRGEDPNRFRDIVRSRKDRIDKRLKEMSSGDSEHYERLRNMRELRGGGAHFSREAGTRRGPRTRAPAMGKEPPRNQNKALSGARRGREGGFPKGGPSPFKKGRPKNSNLRERLRRNRTRRR